MNFTSCFQPKPFYNGQHPPKFLNLFSAIAVAWDLSHHKCLSPSSQQNMLTVIDCFLLSSLNNEQCSLIEFKVFFPSAAKYGEGLLGC